MSNGYGHLNSLTAALLPKRSLIVIAKILLAYSIIVFLISTSVLAQAPNEADIRGALDRGLATALKVRMQGYSALQIDRKLHSWYEQRTFSPLWFADGKLSPRADDLRAALYASIDDGLRPNDYFVQQIEERWSSAELEKLAELDLLLTLAAVRLATDARIGRYELRAIDTQPFAGSRLEPPELVTDVLDVANQTDIAKAIREQFPRHRQYLRMKQALADYRKIAVAGGWGTIPGIIPLRPGSSGPRVHALVERLTASGDLIEKIGPDESYGVLVEAAVKSFQRRHGIPPTGEVHARTLAELNVPVEQRILSLLINLERWRWLDRDFIEKKAVYVNIAGYELFALKGPTPELRLPVIVGKAFHATPVFSDLIEYIEFNPYWNVPVSIAANEILPKLKSNAGYLKAEHMRLYPKGGPSDGELSPDSIHWSSVRKSEMHRYSIRQDPGPWNALGALKFVFPNSYSVYLHDTPNRELFAQNKRAFSHGCIRVSNPAQFASFLLETPEDPWPVDRVEELIATGKNQIVRLPHPVPVHLTYRTAWVDRDATVNFRSDLYRRDLALGASLSE